MDCCIKLSKEAVLKCKNFAQACAEHERPEEYGEKDASIRDIKKIEEDTFIGKLGEEAVCELLKCYGIVTEADYDITPRGTWDNFDILYNGWGIDVKASKKTSRNFLIEWSKLQFRADAGELPHFFILTRLAFVFNGLDNINYDECCVHCLGYVSTLELCENNDKVFVLNKGDNIPGTKTMMTAQSFGIAIDDLNTDWQNLTDMMKNNKPYPLADYEAPGILTKKQEPVSKKLLFDFGPRYSMFIASANILKYNPEYLEKEIKSGIKILLFVNESTADTFQNLSQKYSRNNFSLYTIPNDMLIPELLLYDGMMSAYELKQLTELAKAETQHRFNLEQHLIEHAGRDCTMIIKASAGTGKTTVMIDRIMYILSVVKNIQPADIGMITFTNKAAQSMMEKLQTRLIDMYKITGLNKYLEMLEQLSDMQISTIDSFFKSIIANEGSVLGYGTDVKLKGLVYEKKNIIRDLVNTMYINEQPKDILKSNILSIQNLVDTAFWLWNELHSRGYFLQDIYNMDFGEAEGRSTSLNQKLKELIVAAESSYQKFKHNNNTFTISDIKADMDEISRSIDNVTRQKKFKFLFVDEFQDTDNSQIRTLAWMQRVFGCQLFVVGDVKQSIYRFRGAEESAFAELKKQLKQNGVSKSSIKAYKLIKNYRTSANVINKLNNIFHIWNDRKLLSWYTDADSCIVDSGTLQKNVYPAGEQDFCSSAFPKIKELMEISRQVAILCRNNREVQKIADYCRNQGVTCIAVMKGNFYKTRPVRDFYALLDALLYPTEPRRLYNLLCTPYTSQEADLGIISSFNGSEEKLLAYFQELLAHDNWNAIQKQKRTISFFNLILKIFRINPLDRMASMRRMNNSLYMNTNDCELDIQFYIMNFNKLMQILYDSFSKEYASLLDVYNFLDNKIKTDNQEDAIYPEQSSTTCTVEAMTVHKAKGLEFESVVIPFVSRPFIRKEGSSNNVLITDNSSGVLKAGWKIPGIRSGDTPLYNNYYQEMNENENQAVRREEARLLYVALTRARRNLAVFVQEYPHANTWSDYLKDIQEVF